MHKTASSAAPSATASARLTIDLAALAANYALLRQQVAADCRVAGVVKADAYGLGLEPVVSVLERAGCPHYWVIDPDEPSIIAFTMRDGVFELCGQAAGTETFAATEPLSIAFTPDELID